MIRSRVTPRMAAALALLAASCTTDPGGGAAPATDASRPADARPPRADTGPGRRDGGPRITLRLRPEQYDCQSFRESPPARTSKVPLGCVRDPRCRTLLVTGHRATGGDLPAFLRAKTPQYAPENSLAAIRAAILLGADIVEFDVRRTKDGELVLMHDSTVDRTTTGTGKVSELTLADLRKLRLEADGLAGKFDCERVPTLREALALIRGRVNVDLDLKTDAAAQVARAVKAAGVREQVFISTSSTSRLAAARKAVPDILIQARATGEAAIKRVIATFTPPPEIVEVKEPDLVPATMKLIRDAGARVFVDAFVPYDVQAYATGRASVYAPLVKKGPDIIQADRVDLLLAHLGR